MIRLLLSAACALTGCAHQTLPGIDTVQRCPGWQSQDGKADSVPPHICHLGDKLALWKARERRRVQEGFDK